MKNKNIDLKKLSLYDMPEDSPGYLLWKVSIKWRSQIEKVLKECDLTYPQFVILAATCWLTNKNNKISQIDISKSSGLDPNTTSQVLRGLELKKLITRRRSLNERNKNPVLTPLGLDRLSQAMPAVETADKLFFDLLDLEESNVLLKIFQKLIP